MSRLESWLEICPRYMHDKGYYCVTSKTISTEVSKSQEYIARTHTHLPAVFVRLHLLLRLCDFRPGEHLPYSVKI
jgi:hypothetical protein